jgi:DNA invertase Pin-like site-specific DNA recombinase
MPSQRTTKRAVDPPDYAAHTATVQQLWRLNPDRAEALIKIAAFAVQEEHAKVSGARGVQGRLLSRLQAVHDCPEPKGGDSCNSKPRPAAPSPGAATAAARLSRSRGAAHEGRYLRSRQHGGSDLRQPADRTSALRRGTRLDGSRVVDTGVSGSTDKRPALDALIRDAKRRRFDLLVCWRLDRLGRNLRHLVTLIDELSAVGVGFASLGEGIDTQTPAGRLQLHVLAALAEFERGRIRERVVAGLQRARAQGKRLGRPRKARAAIAVPGGSVRDAARVWGVSKSTAARWVSAGRLQP